MFDKLLKLDVPAADLVIRGAVVYIAVLILLRVSGKRQIGQMGVTEFVAILLISNAVQNAMNGGDNSLVGGLLLAAVLIALSTTLTFFTFKSKAISVLFEGVPTILVHKGKIIPKNMSKERLRESELKALLRKQGVHNLAEVETAILEADGTFSITKKAESAPAST